MREIPASPEDGVTFEENAAQKAIYYSGFTNGVLFADDSGLEVDALGGAPGVYSARYAGEHAGDAANNALLLERLEGHWDRRGRFVCVIAVAESGKLIRTFRGTVEGEILRAPRGRGGFGYDPLFFHPESGQTLAEIPAVKKFVVSHRGQALREMLDWFSLCRRHRPH